jgi:hypothetical protein
LVFFTVGPESCNFSNDFLYSSITPLRPLQFEFFLKLIGKQCEISGILAPKPNLNNDWREKIFFFLKNFINFIKIFFEFFTLEIFYRDRSKKKLG